MTFKFLIWKFSAYMLLYQRTPMNCFVPRTEGNRVAKLYQLRPEIMLLLLQTFHIKFRTLNSCSHLDFSKLRMSRDSTFLILNGQADTQAHLAVLKLTDLTSSDFLAGWSEMQFPHVTLSPLIAVMNRNSDFF